MNINNFGRTSFVKWTEAELWQERIEMTEQELLAVLDMSEEKQIMWCLVHTDMREPESLADLALRLRDEAEEKVGLWWSGAISKVFFYVAKTPERFGLSTEDRMNQFKWLATKAKPIHLIIIALIALIAKEKEE